MSRLAVVVAHVGAAVAGVGLGLEEGSHNGSDNGGAVHDGLVDHGHGLLVDNGLRLLVDNLRLLVDDSLGLLVDDLGLLVDNRGLVDHGLLDVGGGGQDALVEQLGVGLGLALGNVDDTGAVGDVLALGGVVEGLHGVVVIS